MKKQQNLVSSISAFITGSLDEGLLVISGKLSAGISFEQLDRSLRIELEKIQTSSIENGELNRILNKIRTSKEFQDQGILNRAMNLCFYELLGDANGINIENEKYQNITANDILRVAKKTLNFNNCSLLKVKAINNGK